MLTDLASSRVRTLANAVDDLRQDFIDCFPKNDTVLAVSLPTTPGIENLPFELQRNFNLMRDLDQRTEGENNELCRSCGWCVQKPTNFCQQTSVKFLFYAMKC